MEEWLSEFQAWFAKEDDYCSFAQELLQEFYNWETEEEQAYPEITDEFLIKTFQGLHLLVQKTLNDRIEAEDNQNNHSGSSAASVNGVPHHAYLIETLRLSPSCPAQSAG